MTQHGRHVAPRAQRPAWVHGGMVLVGLVAILVAVVEWSFSSTGRASAAPPPLPVPAAVVTSAAPVPAKKPVKKVIPPVTVRVATFNVLGCGFTWNNGHRGSIASTATYAPCEQRFGPMWSYINAMGHSIVAFEEVQAPVQALFRAQVNAPHSAWGMYPTTAAGPEVAILWRSADWHLVKALDYTTPFFAAGNGFSTVTDRAVLLQHRTGRRVWVMAAHNAPSTTPNWPTALGIDLGTESDLFSRLLGTHVPVLFLADTNDTSNRTLCAFKGKVTGAHSIYGPANCADPGAVNNQNMDKILGSDQIDFNGVLQDWSVQKARITDHGSPSAYATISDQVRKG